MKEEEEEESWRSSGGRGLSSGSGPQSHSDVTQTDVAFHAVKNSHHTGSLRGAVVCFILSQLCHLVEN